MDKQGLIAGWSLTKMCNLHCMHCYSASGKPGLDELSTEEAFRVVDKLEGGGVVAVNFGGGECALREDFPAIVEYLFNQDIKVSYTTNGTVFPRIKPILPFFHDVGVSIDFADAERHDWFRGMKGTYSQAIGTIVELVARKVDTEMVTCLTRLNCAPDELGKMYDLAKDLGVDYWRLNRFRANGRGIATQDMLSLSQKDLRTAYSFLAGKMQPGASVPDPLFRSAYGGKYFIPGDPSGYTAFRILSNGEVSPSVFLSISGGNIKDKSLDEILHSPVFKAIRDRSPQGKCIPCQSYSHCRGGDAGASYLAYDHFNGPDPLCWLEPHDMRPGVKKAKGDHWNVHELYLCTVYIPMKEVSRA
ncbi:MAG: radical SAM protein [Nanoarchaeota archaeon]